jgi:hypothetical protein
MRRTIAGVLAALALALVLSAGSALGSQSGVITGEGGVADTVISVIVPVNLDFTLDPLEIEAEGGNQIVPANYMFINYTGAPVKVSLDIEARLKGGASLADGPGEISKDDPSATDKKLYFAILGADSLEQSGEGPDAFKGVYDAKKDTLVPFSAETNTASVHFVLAPATESAPGAGYDTLAEGGMGVAAFQFYANLNTYAAWRDGDVEIHAVYTLTPLRKPAYESYINYGGFTEDGWNTQLALPLLDLSGLGMDGTEGGGVPEPGLDGSSPTSPGFEAPNETFAPIASEKPFETVEPMETAEPSETPEPVEPLEPTGTEPVETPEPVDTEPVETPEPVDTEPVEPSEPVETEPVEPSEPVETEPVEPSEPVDTEPVEPSEPVETEPVEPSEPVDTEPVEASEPVDTEPVEPSEPIDTEPVEPSEP